MKAHEISVEKSSYSGGQGNCVEVASLPDVTAVRDSKQTDGPVLRFTSAQGREFVGAVKAGTHDR